MRVAVISDTHLDEPTPWFKRVFDEHLAKADAIIHCGDISGDGMVRFLEASHPNVHMVCGNMCTGSARRHLAPRIAVTLEGFRVGASHGTCSQGSSADYVLREFGPDFDVICYGHTHVFDWRKIDGRWVLNPGALQEGEGSFAYLDLVPGEEPKAVQVRV